MKCVVNGMWVGKELGNMELLTINSFVDHGHEFHLWAYDDIETKLPDGVVVRDAREILKEEKVFHYPKDSDIDMEFGKGSYAGFSDIFRYKLLYELGGWWVDMDVTCLQSLRGLDYDGYFFRNHWDLPLVGNIMKVPPGSELMERCYREASENITKDNREWHKPIWILCDAVKDLGLSTYVRYGLGSIDHICELELYFSKKIRLPDAWYFVHWMNALGNKNVQGGSALCFLLRKYGLWKDRKSFI